jgi:hypothetical protein
MRGLIKRLLISGYCRGWIPARSVTSAFHLLKLKDH